MSDETRDPEYGSEDRPGPTIRDRRKIDPVTGEVRPSAPSASGGPAGGAADRSSDSAPGDAEIVGLQAELAERTGDLQRVQAEYLNYRRRVERDREAVRELATANVLTSLFPVLDDIGRAQEHGELVGGFKSVADAIDQALTKLGLVRFGEVGDPFDPVRHEALLHSYSDEVTETTCTQVFAQGYQLGERVLRPARVAVADPTEALPGDSAETTGPAEATGPAETTGSARDSAEPPDAAESGQPEREQD